MITADDGISWKTSKTPSYFAYFNAKLLINCGSESRISKMRKFHLVGNLFKSDPQEESSSNCMVIKMGRQLVCTTPMISRICFPYTNRYAAQKVPDMNNPFLSSPEARVYLNISLDKLFKSKKDILIFLEWIVIGCKKHE